MDNFNLFTPIAGKSVVDRVVDSITDAIVCGTLKPGDQIPTETEMALSMNVSRNSIREAIKILESMGVLNIRRAEGTFVAQGFKERMLDPVLYGLILENGPASDIIELRRIFEYGTLQLATEKATKEDISALERALKNLEDEALSAVIDHEALHKADVKFHEAVERCAQNRLVMSIGQLIGRLTNPTRRKTIETFIGNSEIEKFVELHRQLLNVVRDRDKDSVRHAIEEHYQYWIMEFK